jgi:hypothetical protein
LTGSKPGMAGCRCARRPAAGQAKILRGLNARWIAMRPVRCIGAPSCSGYPDNPRCDWRVGFCFVLPIPYTSIAVTQKEIAIHIGPDNARLFLAPPRSSAVSSGFTNEARDYKIAIFKGKANGVARRRRASSMVSDELFKRRASSSAMRASVMSSFRPPITSLPRRRRWRLTADRRLARVPGAPCCSVSDGTALFAIVVTPQRRLAAFALQRSCHPTFLIRGQPLDQRGPGCTLFAAPVA